MKQNGKSAPISVVITADHFQKTMIARFKSAHKK